jgi:hypothetical protein
MRIVRSGPNAEYGAAGRSATLARKVFSSEGEGKTPVANVIPFGVLTWKRKNRSARSERGRKSHVDGGATKTSSCAMATSGSPSLAEASARRKR